MGLNFGLKKFAVALAFSASVMAAGVAKATDIEVTHWWTSGGEAAAVAEFAKAVDASGDKWVDGAIAGSGDVARPIIISRILGGNPMGATQFLFANQPLAFLASESAVFPVITREAEIISGEYRGKGYEIEEASGRPVFKYTYQGIDVEDKIYPDDQGRSIAHEVNIKNRGTKTGLYYKLAEGKSIQQMPNGAYAIDDKSFYIRMAQGATPKIREVDGKQELFIPVENSFSYSIIW